MDNVKNGDSYIITIVTDLQMTSILGAKQKIGTIIVTQNL
jgi:hypothetical protein